MPQIDILTYFPQFFWFIFSMCVLVNYMFNKFLPKISKIWYFRKRAYRKELKYSKSYIIAKIKFKRSFELQVLNMRYRGMPVSMKFDLPNSDELYLNYDNVWLSSRLNLIDV
uniref:ATP synthase F0 subunit 8 n=1 Tax=Sphaerothecum destruens TaxID=42893 RepID=A0A6H2U2P4_9EUKA|nr:ATP synthase F0 subunit 8 [Sphaerothecum destruens]QID02702.1 ATP synthase F0 subunit 8 [Sphaerothecum destruens]